MPLCLKSLLLNRSLLLNSLYLPWDICFPTSESFAQMLQNCSGFVLFDSFRHHIKNIVHNGGSKFQIEMGFNSLFGDSFSHTCNFMEEENVVRNKSF